MEGNSPPHYCDNPFLPPSLNEDSLIQILLWLPVISLLRFKSVCKSWLAIIQNSFFIHTHATTTTTTTTTPVFLRYSYHLRRGDIFTVSGDQFEVLEDLGIPGPEFEDSDPDESTDYYRNPYYTNKNARYENITMAGCCNGIICLHDKDNPKCNVYPTISLWNPAIKQYRFLPIPFALEDKNYDPDYVDYFIEFGVDVKRKYVEHFVGFGFDIKTKDYKVLLITYDIYVGREYHYSRGVQVYSLSSDTWRCIDASDAQPNLILRWEDRDQGHYLNGTYLFIAGYLYEGEFQEATNSRQECFKDVIMSFDFTEEIFRTIQLPFDLKSRTETQNYAYMILFGEKIAVTNAYEDSYCSDTTCFDIWVLNEYGGSESWSKFYTFANARPKFITNNGEFIFLGASQGFFPKLQLLNVVTEEIKDLQYDCEGLSFGNAVLYARFGVYKPSLIPIAGNGVTNNCY